MSTARRRWFSFSLRTLFVAVTVLASIAALIPAFLALRVPKVAIVNLSGRQAFDVTVRFMDPDKWQNVGIGEMNPGETKTLRGSSADLVFAWVTCTLHGQPVSSPSDAARSVSPFETLMVKILPDDSIRVGYK